MSSIHTPRLKLVLVTFDLNNPSPGDLRYRKIDRFLAAIGTVMRPLKQARLVITTATLASIRETIRDEMGLRGNLAVLRVSRRSAIEVSDPGIRDAVRRAIASHGSP